jgi:plasmid stabilization system protein ParE
MIVSLSPEAEAELIEAARHYAQEAGAQLGLALIAEFERTLTLLSEHPQLGAPWRGCQRMSLRRFPYSVIYTVSDRELRVLALAHHRRKPSYWAGRK